MPWLTALAAACLAAWAFREYGVGTPATPSPSDEAPAAGEPASPRRIVATEATNYTAIALGHFPVVVTNSTSTRWAAAEEWDRDFFCRALPILPVYVQADSSVFRTFHDGKPLEAYCPRISWEQFNVKHNRSCEEVASGAVDRVEPHNLSRAVGPHTYFSASLRLLRPLFAPQELDQWIRPYDHLLVDKRDDVQINVWLGRAGVVTDAHHDNTHNFFFQLRGRKRFTLFPPETSSYLYPCLHPHVAHSQVDVLAPNKSRYPLFDAKNSVVVDLEPGDLLVLPPFWLHHVLTLEDSVSVNL